MVKQDFTFSIDALRAYPQIAAALDTLVSAVADAIDGLEDEATPMEYQVVHLNITGIGTDDELHVVAQIESDV